VTQKTFEVSKTSKVWMRKGMDAGREAVYNWSRSRVHRAIRVAAGIACAAALALGCVSCGAPRVVKIGLAGSFEGLYRSSGYEALYAVKLAVAEWNSRGGVAGHPVELVALDDSGSAEQARRQPAELAADPDVLGAVGHTQSDTTAAALAEYDRLSLPLVSPAAWTRNPGSQWIFFAAGSYMGEAIAALRDAGLQGGSRIAVVDGGEEWLALSSWWASVLKAGDAAPPGARGVVLAGPADRAAEWARQYAALGVPLVGGSDLGSGVFAALAGESAAGVRVGHTAVLAGAAEWELFRKNYAALTGSEPGLLAPVAYDAANALLAAMERAAKSGDLSRAGVARALRDTDWPGLTGRITFAAAALDGARTQIELGVMTLP
jgi:branched-chain amino acid transport system substrate-binding protein